MDREFEGQRETLYALIRGMHRKRRAGEIIDAFEATLASHDAAERANILEYWIDFYRLRRYQREHKRRRPTYRERLQACSACGYPSSHRHHLWELAMHGENQVTIQLCANCHELQHLMYNALVKDSEHSRKLVLHIMYSGRIPRERVELILGWCRATIRYEASNGWTDGERASDQWVEYKFGWKEYLESVKPDTAGAV
jgi:ribosomal protein L37E